jgi:UDP-sugar transporter A1/2/3
LVGLVTKYSGSVRKGFALIIGMFLSGILQNQYTMDESHPTKDGHNKPLRVQPQQWLGGILAAISLYLHTSYAPITSSR